jgi:hypothetical protein
MDRGSTSQAFSAACQVGSPLLFSYMRRVGYSVRTFVESEEA